MEKKERYIIHEQSWTKQTIESHPKKNGPGKNESKKPNKKRNHQEGKLKKGKKLHRTTAKRLHPAPCAKERGSRGKKRGRNSKQHRLETEVKGKLPQESGPRGTRRGGSLGYPT